MFSRSVPRFACGIGSGAYKPARGITGPHQSLLLGSRVLCNPAIFIPSSQKRRPFHSTTTRTSQLNEMAATKEYRLLALENPLLGKLPEAFPKVP